MDSNFKHLNSQASGSEVILNSEICKEPVPDIWTTGDAPGGRRLVYLLSRFPAISHTFFLNEVQELRKIGFDIEVASINQPDHPRSSMIDAEAYETDKTFYIKSSGAIQALWVAIRTLVSRPSVFARGLIAALQLGRWAPHSTMYALFYFVEALILGEWMRIRSHSHLHIHFCGPVATVGMLTSIAWGYSYSLTVHGPDEFYDVEGSYLREKVVRAKFILCISDFCRSQLMRVSAPVHWDKMSVVRLGIDPHVFSPSGKTRMPGEMLEVLCVGRLVASKGQLILLRACEWLTSRGYLFRLRLVGGGPDEEYLKQYAAQKNLPVVFEGARNHEETRKLFACADVFALASFAEGVPVALMEAMAMEIPCVSTCIAGIPELIRDGLEGLLVPASSVETLASALQRLFDDPLLRRSLGVAGGKRVNEEYNLRRNVCSLARVLNQRLPASC